MIEEDKAPIVLNGRTISEYMNQKPLEERKRDPDIFDKIIEQNRTSREVRQEIPSSREDPY